MRAPTSIDGPQVPRFASVGNPCAVTVTWRCTEMLVVRGLGQVGVLQPADVRRTRWDGPGSESWVV